MIENPDAWLTKKSKSTYHLQKSAKSNQSNDITPLFLFPEPTSVMISASSFFPFQGPNNHPPLTENQGASVAVAEQKLCPFKTIQVRNDARAWTCHFFVLGKDGREVIFTDINLKHICIVTGPKIFLKLIS